MSTTAERTQAQLLLEITRLADVAKLAAALPDLPEPFQISTYNMVPADKWTPQPSIGVEAYQDESTSWADRTRVLGITLRAFKAHSITREVRDNTTSVRYTASGQLTDGTECKLSVHIWRGGINPTCRVETEQYQETVTRTRVKVVCE